MLARHDHLDQEEGEEEYFDGNEWDDEEELDDDDYDDDDDNDHIPGDVIVSRSRGGGGKKTRKEEVLVGGWNRNGFVEGSVKLREQHRAKLADRVAAWRASGRNAKVMAREPIRALLPDIIAYLLASYRDDIERNTAIPHGKLIVEFGEGPAVHCVQETGVIRFGWGILTGRIDDQALSNYGQEQQPMREICASKEDVLMWLVLHEFLHLFRGNEAHTVAFFAKITEAACKHSFLFSSQERIAAATAKAGP